MRDERLENARDDDPVSMRQGAFECVCTYCDTALADDRPRCTSCGAARPPDDGWRPLDEVADPWLGSIVDDRYRLVQRIGDGISASVYRARRPHLDQRFAVKVVDLETSPAAKKQGASVIERIEREIRIMSRATTPHVVDFYDVLELPGEAIAVVMDCVRGETLRAYLERHERCPLGECLQIGLDVTSGLRDIHRRGAVHRDLKPSNIMLRDSAGDETIAVLIDFGIVQFTHETRRTEGFVGTPLYASPEQARIEDTDFRSDLYSLGTVLFHVLTGRPPFVRRELTDLLSAHERETTPRLSEVAPDRAFPDGLESLIASLTAKQPEQRPKGAAQVLQQLRACRETIDGSTEFGSDPLPMPAASPTAPSRLPAPVSSAFSATRTRCTSLDGSTPCTAPLEPTTSIEETAPSGKESDDGMRAEDGGALAVRATLRGDVSCRSLDTSSAEQRSWQHLGSGPSVTALAAHAGAPDVVAVARENGTISIFSSFQGFGAPQRVTTYEEAPGAMRISSDGHLLAVEFEECLELHAVTTGEHVESLELDGVSTLDEVFG